MPFFLFNYPTTTTNTIDMLMQRKKMIVRIPDAYLWFKKPNLKKLMICKRKYTWIIVK